jgi:hypothetical protein
MRYLITTSLHVKQGFDDIDQRISIALENFGGEDFISIQGDHHKWVDYDSYIQMQQKLIKLKQELSKNMQLANYEHLFEGIKE